MSAFKKIGVVLVALIAIGLTASLGLSGNKTQKLKLIDVPQTVKAAALNAMDGGLQLADEVEVEVEKGQRVYEFKATLDGKVYEVEVSETGEVLEVELDDDDEDDDDDDDDDKD